MSVLKAGLLSPVHQCLSVTDWELPIGGRRPLVCYWEANIHLDKSNCIIYVSLDGLASSSSPEIGGEESSEAYNIIGPFGVQEVPDSRRMVDVERNRNWDENEVPSCSRSTHTPCAHQESRKFVLPFSDHHCPLAGELIRTESYVHQHLSDECLETMGSGVCYSTENNRPQFGSLRYIVPRGMINVERNCKRNWDVCENGVPSCFRSIHTPCAHEESPDLHMHCSRKDDPRLQFDPFLVASGLIKAKSSIHQHKCYSKDDAPSSRRRDYNVPRGRDVKMNCNQISFGNLVAHQFMCPAPPPLLFNLLQ
uniref:Uncharacterized protein n=1 Tax=Branchiostoma floridae TaxID=7739 RepID=C3Y3V4_BRAFL|eukprot:XP_002608970.1 hypothetical protein BRAFLDRAFT_104973 [Branchiostoma floridae]